MSVGECSGREGRGSWREVRGEFGKADTYVTSGAVMSHDKAELQKRCSLLEKEKAAAGAGPSQGTSGGMTAKQVEEVSRMLSSASQHSYKHELIENSASQLERQFAAQESLLNGYAKESERSFAETEQLKQRYAPSTLPSAPPTSVF